jgi:hypothetical protein
MRRTIPLLALILLIGACGGTDTTTIVATVADQALEADGLGPGSPLADAELRFYVGDDVIVETTLDGEGRAEVDLAPGTYTVQVDLPISGTECFWGETLFDVTVPGEAITIEAWHICPG